MGMNRSRILLGGLLAGVVINSVEFLTRRFLFDNRWKEAMETLGKTVELKGVQIVVLNLWGFAVGLAAVWLYAAILSRYSPGPRTAWRAACLIWFVGYFLSTVWAASMDLLPVTLLGGFAAAGFAEVVAGTQFGAWIYRDPRPSATPAVTVPE